MGRKILLKEVIVVEGKMDVVAVHKALEADCLTTGGFTLSPKILADIKSAYQKRGIIILTDPDAAGERIRRYLTKHFPKAKHAFVPREEATANDDIGIEQASPAAIRTALAKVHTKILVPQLVFSSQDMIAAGLSGAANSAQKRAKLGAALGLGFANAKTFLKRLNNYGVTREEFATALNKLA